MYATKRKNKTFNASKLEEYSYELLCRHFGNEDVIHQYHSDKYPFCCDFYIKSRDLYIECNFSWTHGGHWFDATDENDIARVELMRSKHSQYYDNAIQTWTVRDVKKKQCAEKNELNYLVFWKVVELEQWLQSNRVATGDELAGKAQNFCNRKGVGL